MALLKQKYVPHEYQKQAIKFMLEKSQCALFLDPGLGKTSTVLAAFKILRKQGFVKRMLVIAPLRVALSVWPREVNKWAEFSDLREVVMHGPNKLAMYEANADIYIINPEGLKWFIETVRSRKDEWMWDMLVLDESTKFKHTNTERFKQLKRILPLFSRRYILTGSPAPNGLMDLFGQFYVVDLGRTLGQFITHYRNTFFYSTGFGGYTYELKEGSAKAINDRIAPRSLRMNAEDYIKLPPLIYNRVRVELPEKAKLMYDQMETLLFAQIREGEVVNAVNAAAASMKCRQIANGGLYKGTGGQEWEQIHDAKLEATADLVDELGGKPALIVYEFKHDLERLLRAFPDAAVMGGGTSPKKMREIEDGWNGGRIPILLAQPQSVAHGLNLQEVGAAVIFHSLIWDLELTEQLIRRVWRQGQKSRVVVHYVMAADTIDYVIASVVNGKDKRQRDLMTSLKNYVHDTDAEGRRENRYGKEDDNALLIEEG